MHVARPAVPALLLALVVFVPGCSVALKGGVHRFDSGDLERSRDSPTIAVTEFEIGVGRYMDDRVDLAVGFDIVEAPDGTDFQDFRLTSRYNFRQRKRLSPYLGGGPGWFRWFTKQAVTLVPEICLPTLLDPERCTFLESVTIANGSFWHAVGGLNITVSPTVDLVVEDRFDFSKSDDGIDFGSNQILFGVRGRWE